MKMFSDIVFTILAAVKNFLEILVAVFIGLKVTGLLDWSWVWIFTPVWAPAILVAYPTYYRWREVQKLRKELRDIGNSLVKKWVEETAARHPEKEKNNPDQSATVN